MSGQYKIGTLYIGDSVVLEMLGLAGADAAVQPHWAGQWRIGNNRVSGQ